MTEYVVGRFYQVPSVRVRRWYLFAGWLPVVGPKHEDAGVVNFPYPHFHIDWRFAPKRAWRFATLRGTERAYGWPIMCPDANGQQMILEGPVLRLMKCKRPLPAYPTKNARWLPELREQFACSKLTNGVCPHRGIPVSAMIRDGDVLTCPAHGLRWDAITGAPL